ncbi:hypothetical protein QD67_001040 [Salmonella enterica subsp. enterica]|nr:hypothetical protein [Salmonella enterica subsp. enterica]
MSGGTINRKRNPGKENINQKSLPYCFLMLIGTACGSWLALVQVVILTRGKEFFALYVRESTASYIDELEEVEPFIYSISELSRPLQRIIKSPAGGKHGKYFK